MREGERHAAGSNGGSPPSQGRSSFLKRAVRKAVRVVYRLALPIVRPLAFRTRRYLAQTLQDELQGVKVELHGAKVELQVVRDELHRMHAELTHDVRHAHTMQLDALHRTTASLQHEVLVNAQHWHETGFKDAQKLSLGLHQSIQASRELVREEVLRCHEDAHRELQAVVAASRESTQLATDAHVFNMSSRLDRIEQFSAASARRMAVHGDHDAILVKSAVGYVLCADSDHAVLAGLLEADDLNCGTRLLIQRFVEPGDIFVDVGAHLGLLSLAAAQAMHGKGKIIVFEPFPGTRSLLEKTFRMNGFAGMLEVHGAAVSNRVGEETLFLGTTSERHSIVGVDLPSGYPKEKMSVASVTLDSALPSGQTVNLLRIDAGGAELEIIEGAHSLISGNPNMALIMELSSLHLKRAGHSLDKWFTVFDELGLIYFVINPDTGMLENMPMEQLVMADSINLFFARPDSLAWKRLDVKA